LNYLFISVSLFVLAAIVSGNNLSAGVGSLLGSNVTGRKAAVLIAIVGFTSGFLVGVNKMSRTVNALFPYGSFSLFLIIWASVLVFIVAQIARTPISLTMALVGISFGIFLRHDVFSSIAIIERIIAMWIIAPPLAIGISYAISTLLTRRKASGIWRTANVMRFLLIFLGFISSFTLGENTLGFIGALGRGSIVSSIFVAGGIVFGSAFLSWGPVKTIGRDMYSISYSNAFSSLLSSSLLVEAATLVGLPLSNTQALTSGIIGAGLGRKMRVLSLRPVVRVLLLWFVSPVVGVILGIII